MNKIIWTRDEIPIADELESLIPRLRDDFLNHHTDFYQDFASGTPYSNSNFSVDQTMSAPGVWKIQPIRYNLPDFNIVKEFDVENIYPTASAFTKKYAGHVGCATYNVLEGNSFLRRHTDPENRDRRFVRLHIPLIIPKGDLFFEVNGIEITWTNVFAFDNEQLHSAYNYSPNRRLIFLLELSRELLGFPPGERYLYENEIMTDFVRGQKPKLQT
jgi:hypothetical protein